MFVQLIANICFCWQTSAQVETTLCLCGAEYEVESLHRDF
jgi:hypothetical protein